MMRLVAQHGVEVRLASLAIVLGAVSGVVRGGPPVFGPGDQRAASAALSDAAHHILRLTESQVQSLNPAAGEDGTIVVPIEIEGRSWTLSLRKHSVRSDDFQVLMQRVAGGPLVAVAPPPVQTYRGTILEVPGSRAAGSFVSGRLNLAIRTPTEIYGVQALADLGLDAGPDQHVIFRMSDHRPDREYKCGTEGAHAVEPEGESDGGVAGTGLMIADLAIDADVEFFQLNGSSEANTVLDIETVMDTVEFIYERDVAITYEITTIVIRTAEPDPYNFTAASALLNEFANTWSSGSLTFVRRDTAHLFTGKNLDVPVIGVAYLGGLCSSSSGYGLSESRWSTNFPSRVALTAHEIGHNWNATHCDGDPNGCHIMCSGLGGCNGIAGDNLKFGQTEKSQISSYRNSRTCIAPLADPQGVPFFDNFSSTVLSTSKWIYIQGGIGSDQGEGEPSAPYALNLDAPGSQTFRDDEVRSNFINLAGAGNPRLSYYTQHRGVDAGETLTVEYWNDNFDWVTVNEIVSDGVDQAAFDFYEHDLAADAAHAEFRLRFRVQVDSIGDDWYIDDVFVRGVCVDSTECDDGEFCNGAEQCVDGECATGAYPCGGTESCNEVFDHCYDPVVCPAPAVEGAGCRYIGITPADGTTPVGFLVHPICDVSQGQYVGAPSGPANTAALVVSPGSAAFRTPVAWNGTVFASGAIVTPSATVGVRGNCGTTGAPIWSDTVLADTVRFGDAVGNFVSGAWQPPDGSVDIVSDVIAILDRFRNLASAPPMYRVDLIGIAPSGITCGPDQGIDIIDATLALDAFRGEDFSTATGCAEPCP